MSFNNYTIREIIPADVDMLRHLSIDTFCETYAIYNTDEDMELHVDGHFNRQQLLNEIMDESCYFFVAELGNIPAGYIKLRTSEKPAELEGCKHIELERIYALKQYQGTGLGKLLIDKCVNFAVENNYEVLWLGVWKRNEKALHFYTKSGFTFFGEQVFTLGADVQVDWLMKKMLNHPS